MRQLHHGLHEVDGMGSAMDLEVSKGRWSGTARGDRLCPRCAGRHVEDEKHVMFECYWYMICVSVSAGSIAALGVPVTLPVCCV
jgi:hypothetical protein